MADSARVGVADRTIFLVEINLSAAHARRADHGQSGNRRLSVRLAGGKALEAVPHYADRQQGPYWLQEHEAHLAIAAIAVDEDKKAAVARVTAGSRTTPRRRLETIDDD
jgi:hypothetical protein